MNIKLSKRWIKVPIGEIFRTAAGGTPSTVKPEYWRNGTIPWLNSGALRDEVITNSSNFITEKALQENSLKIFPRETVVVALTGATTGRVGFLEFESTTNQSVVGILPSKFVIPKYTYYFMLSIRNYYLENLIGSAQLHINKRIIDETLFPLAPQNEQQLIVAKLDKLMETLKISDQKIQKFLELEDQILRSFIFKNGDLYPPVKLGNFCTEERARIGQNWKRKKLIGVSKDTGIIDLSTGKKKSFENYKIVYPGCFIYNPMRVNIGSIAIWEGNENAITSPDYIVFKIKDTLSPLMVLKYLKSNYGLSEINQNTKGSVRSRLYFRNLANINLPFNGREEQIKAQSVLKAFKSLKNENKSLQRQWKRLKLEMLMKAFSGKLVQPISSNESIKELLKKIRNERIESILEDKAEKKIKTKKMKPIKEEPQSILQILEQANGQLSTKEVWEKSIYRDNIEDFYSELKRLIDKEKKIIDIKQDNNTFLKLVS